MATLSLSKQAAAANAFRNALEPFRTELEKRRSLWEKLTPAQRKAWLQSDRDPVLQLALAVYKYLDAWVERLKDDLP